MDASGRLRVEDVFRQEWRDMETLIAERRAERTAAEPALIPQKDFGFEEQPAKRLPKAKAK